MRKGTQMILTVDTLSFASVGGNPGATVDGIALSSYLYVGGIPHDDSEAIAFIRRNHLDQRMIEHGSQYTIAAVKLLYLRPRST